MEDSEAPRPGFQRRRLGSSPKRARRATGPAPEYVPVARDRPLPMIAGPEDEAGDHPRVEIVIATETVRLSVTGEVTSETLAALTAVANGLRSGGPAMVMALAGDHGAGPQAAVARANEPESVAGSQGRPGSRIIVPFRQAVAAGFRVVRDIVTELIARVLGHVLGFPP